jgi:predicted ATPase
MRLEFARFEARDYKSLVHVVLPLRGLTVLVGRNGSGKSNVVDALGFVADALRTDLDYALREWRGVGEVLRRASGPPSSFRLSFHLEPSAHYEVEIAPVGDRGYEVVREEACVGIHRYRVERGSISEARYPYTLPQTPGRNSGKCSRAKSPKRPRMRMKKACR